VVDSAVGERLHVLQDDQVSHQGQPIALVIAGTLEQANHAATLVRVTYAPETGTTDISRIDPVLPTPQQGGGPSETRRGEPEGALAAAEVKVDETYVIPRENHNPIEMHATIAAWEGERLTLWDKTQWVHNTADEIAAVFGIPAENIRVISPFVGGAFGSGLRTWPHVTLAALGARVAGRPVKLMLSRREMYYSVGYRPHTVQRVALGASRDGRLAAVTHDGYQETSTYEEFTEALLSATRFLHSCPNVYTRHRLAPMSVHTPTYMRAPGEASGVFALESAMDELAVALNIDPVDLRLRNEPEQDEFKNLPFSSRSTRECYQAAAERFGWSRRNPEPRSMRDGRWLIGWGMASATYPMNYAPASATARLLPDGTAEVTSAASDMGPGTWTSMTQVAAETLGLPIERVKFILGDTRLPRAPVHGGSMTMASVGSAVQAACRRAREDALARGGANDLTEAMRRLGQPVEASADVRPGDESQRFSMHSFGAVFVEVAVDPDLGETRVRRIVGAYGAGRIVNPKTTRSQCIGGMIGGIGMALMEHSVVDARNGRVPNANLAEYAVPVHADAPPLMDVIFVEEHDPHVNPLGVKGVGEIAMVGVAPAITNAIFHATGKRVRELPVTPDKLL
jgi:xanthine dehydrogenase YagR molybdenum-binding subunit